MLHVLLRLPNRLACQSVLFLFYFQTGQMVGLQEDFLFVFDALHTVQGTAVAPV